MVTAVVLCIPLFAGGCNRESLEELATVVLRRTVPPGVPEPYATMQRRSTGFTAQWRFQTDMPASAYVKWLNESVGPMFANRRAQPDGAVFSTPFDGDLHTLRVTATPAEGRLNVEATFTATPW